MVIGGVVKDQAEADPNMSMKQRLVLGVGTYVSSMWVL